jgi:Aerotolerance regulator N-terminal/von Willebrand factor type A domain
MSFLTMIVALGFANLAILGWLAAAAAPLLVHLWSRHRHHETPWAAMHFLLAALQKNARRMRLQQWLLLALRTFIIVLVVVAVAEPTSEQVARAGGSYAPAHKVLVFDASYSMAHRHNGTTAFSRAKQLATALVRDSRPADSFTLILMANPARKILGRDVVNHTTVVAEIESLAPLHTSADLPHALRLAEEAVLQAQSPSSRALRHAVYFFTDLQRNTWKNSVRSTSQDGENAAGNRVATLARLAKLRIVDVGKPAAANRAVTRFATSGAFVTLDRDTAFEATLRQFGTPSRASCAVELLIDSTPVAEQIVEVQAGGETQVRFTHRFQAPGRHVVSIRTAGDNLTVDDARYLVVPVREEVRVLCVAGREGAAMYVANALNPNVDGGSAIRPAVVSESDLANLQLSDFDCIFLCNVGQFTPDEAQRLHGYAKNGGGIVFFLGDQVIPESYNALALNSSNRASSGAGHGLGASGKSAEPAIVLPGTDNTQPPLLPARLTELVTEQQFGLDPLDYRHPIVAPFRGRERAGLLTTPVASYFRLEVLESRPDIQIAAAMPSGDPFIVAAPLGRGRTVLVATAGSLASIDSATGQPWTHWPTWPSFLPIVRELLAFALGGQQQQWQQPVGALLGGSLPNVQTFEDQKASLQMFRPDGQTDSVSLQPTPAGLAWSYHAADVSGIYSLRGPPSSQSQSFAMNVDTSESDLAKAEPQQLPSEFSIGDAELHPTHDGESVYESRHGWSGSLLWMCLALMFVESFLAWLFGRGVI